MTALDLLVFHHFYLCFCRHGVKQKNRKAVGLMEFQSSVLCDLQVKFVFFIKKLVSLMLASTISGTLLETSFTSDNEFSNGCIAEKKHACLPLRSLVPPSISPP